MEGDQLLTQFNFSIFEIEDPEKEDLNFFIPYSELITYLIQTTIEVIFFKEEEFKGVSVLAHPNKREIMIGDMGYENFQKRFKQLFK